MQATAFDNLGWQQRALCRGLQAEMFFVAHESEATPAKRVCARCPVSAECAAYALAHQERFGIWGGLTERERRLLPTTEKARLLSRAGMTAA